MALKTHSLFYYGHKVDDTNNMINFKEGAGPEKTAELPVGAYSLTKYLEIVVAALNAASSLDWSGSVDRSTRLVTLISSGTASLLWGSGANSASTPALLLGYTQTDMVNLTSFVAPNPTGYSYSPQFPLQDYKGKDKNKKLVNAVVSKSATGDSVSIQSFGVDRFMKCNIKFITNNPTDGVLRNNTSAVEEAIAFMDYAVEKNPMEFMEDENDPDTFDKVYLENTSMSQDGTSYELMEYVDRNLPEFYESGSLTFKIINLE